MSAAIRAKTRLRDSPFFLLPTVFLAQVIFWASLHFQNTSWQEDSKPPLAVTAAWQAGRVYSPEVEAAIDDLSKTDPAKVAFLRERGIPVNVLTPREMALSGCPPRSLGCTRRANSSINILSIAAVTPEVGAMVLSHELTHAAFHDVRSPTPRLGVWKRLFWRNEETYAHLAGLRTARQLHLPVWSGPQPLWPAEYLVWYWPLGCVVITGAYSFLGLSRIVIHSAGVAQRRRSRQTAATSASQQVPSR